MKKKTFIYILARISESNPNFHEIMHKHIGMLEKENEVQFWFRIRQWYDGIPYPSLKVVLPILDELATDKT